MGVESSRQAFPGIRGDLVELSDHGRATATIKVKPSDIDREAKVDAIATGQNKGNGGCLSVVVTGLTMACESDVQHPSTTGFITAHADCPSLTIRAGSARTFTAHLVENKGFACGAFDAPTVDLTVSFAGKVQ